MNEKEFCILLECIVAMIDEKIQVASGRDALYESIAASKLKLDAVNLIVFKEDIGEES